MSKGKHKSSESSVSEDKEEEEELMHTLADLAEEAGPCPAHRYTASQFTDGIIGLVCRDNGM